MRMPSSAFALALAFLALAGCGQRGPLYLRDSPPPGIRPAKPAPGPVLPYPKRGEDDAEGAKAR
jgi:predicted small lipoprotein YifL